MYTCLHRLRITCAHIGCTCRATKSPFRVALQRAGPRQGREQLLDRYHSHTQHCHACSGALRNVERGLQLSLWGGGLLALAATVYAAVALSGGAVPSTLSGCTAGQGGLVGNIGRFLLSLAVRTLPAGERRMRVP